MAAGTERDPDAALVEEVERAHDVVATLDLMIDVLNAGPAARKQGDRMVHLVDAQQRRVADAVAHTRIAHFRPEGLVPGRIGRVQPDMAEPGDPRIARAVVAGAADGGAPDELDAVARRIGEAG